MLLPLKPTRERLELVQLLRLAKIVPTDHGSLGMYLGKRTGASVEFMDHRPYIWGDDLRRIDWSAYARSDRLLIKQFREENRPVVQIWLDDSASMRLDESKAQFAVDLAALLSQICQVDGLQVEVCELSGNRWPSAVELTCGFTSTEPLQTGVHRSLGRLPLGSMVVLISDFLSPHDASGLVASLASKASAVVCLQVLGQEDIEPSLGRRVCLQDIETGEQFETDIDAAAAAGYVQRLEQLQESLRDACLAVRGRWVSMNSAADFASQCRYHLVEHGLLRVVSS